MQLYPATANEMLPQFAGLELVPTPVGVFDPDRRIRVWNRAAEEVYGWKAHEVIGHFVPTLPPSRIDEYLAISERVRAGETIREYDTIRLRRDGTEVMVSLTLHPVLDAEGNTWVVVSAFDVTERRRLRTELNEGRRRYRALAGALRHTQQQQEELVRLLVHDFKSPIAVTLSSLHYLSSTLGTDDDTREAVADALKSMESLHNMTLNLLDISRSEDGRLVAKRSEVDVPQLLHEVVDPSARSREVPVDLRCEAAASAFVDPDLLRRVVRNLVDNAHKYGGGAPVTVTGERTSEALRITVADRGPGIPAPARERIFDKYYRVEGTSRAKDVRPSHGLGLTFCKLAVEAHGGTIHVTENEPSGCRFVVEIPAA